MSGWITDSGANQHMTDSTKNMFNVVDISSLMLIVGHPNGTLAKFSVIGSLRLTNDVVLFDVLVVPEYRLNLGKLMGAGSKTGGLYMFDVDKIVKSKVGGEKLLVVSGISKSYIRQMDRLIGKVILVAKGYSQRKLDINNAFLYGDLYEDVYMELPPGFYDKNESKVFWFLVFWKSKKQATISRSLSEAEYRCLASTTCELILVVKVLKDLEVDSLLRVDLYCDSSSAIQIAANPVFYEKN
ncbi:hypothetical protein Tco_0404422 [Tanacetum coccineum]